VPQRQERGVGKRGHEQMARVLELDVGELRSHLMNGFGKGAGYGLRRTRFWVAQRFNSLRKNSFHVRNVAKAGLILWNLAARLEAAPFQNGLQTAFFRKI
jgi:hypothetical protein